MGARPTFKLARAWIMLLPFIYYANSGKLQASSDTTVTSGLAHQMALLLVCMICSYFIARHYRAIAGALLKTKAIVALPLLALLSCLWSVDPRQSLISAIPLICFTLFAIYLSETFTIAGQMDLLILIGTVAIVASFALAILAPSFGTSSSGWNGIFAHKQQCAGAVTVFFITGLHWAPRNMLQRLFRVFYLVFGLALIVLSQSRTGWLLLLLAVSLSFSLWLLQKFSARDALFFVLAAIPTTAAFAYVVSLFAYLILTGVGKDPTLSQRTVIWSAVWDAISQHPLLGYGYEAFWQGLNGASHNVILVAGWNLSQAQSGYLDIWVQLGFGGIVCLLVMTGQAGLNALRTFKSAAHPSYVRWCIVVIVCNLIYNIGESDYGYLRILWLLFVVASLGLQKEVLTLRRPSLVQPRPFGKLTVAFARAAEPTGSLPLV